VIQHDRTREQWQDPANPVTSSAPFPAWQQIRMIVVHYPGADFQDMDFDNDGDVDLSDTAILLRNTQTYYTSQRHYSTGFRGGPR